MVKSKWDLPDEKRFGDKIYYLEEVVHAWDTAEHRAKSYRERGYAARVFFMKNRGHGIYVKMKSKKRT